MLAWAILVHMLNTRFFQPCGSATDFTFSRGLTSLRRPTRHNRYMNWLFYTSFLLACRQIGMQVQRHFSLNGWVDRTFRNQVRHSPLHRL